MLISSLKIENFRGIKKSSIVFPETSKIICLIGAGDSTKSTILKAIEWCFWPSWSLSVTDTDFNDCNTENNIVIETTFTDIPIELLNIDKFGLYLRSGDFVTPANDEPVDDKVYLSIRLTINGDLEPHWEVVCNRKEAKQISHKDRQLLCIGVIGQSSEKDMIWSRNSILQKYADSKGVMKEVFTTVMREASANADLRELDDIAKTVAQVGKQFGVKINGNITSKLMINGISSTSAVGVFENQAPLNQRGLGSQKLISMGLNINAYVEKPVLLIDELETGLEPYRIRSLINAFRNDEVNRGQIIMTTHSPVVVAECSISELNIVHNLAGITTTQLLTTGNDIKDKFIQRHIRLNPEAFLSRRIIVCEGKTEIGFIRAIDNYLGKHKNYRMAYSGITTAFGNGESVFSVATQFAKCGYDVCVFMDSDIPAKEIEKAEFCSKFRTKTFSWDIGNSIEEQVFIDTPNELVPEMLQIACIESKVQQIMDRTRLFGVEFVNESFVFKSPSDANRKEIGAISKKDGWYKRIDLGEKFGDIVLENLEKIAIDKKLRITIEGIMEWITKYD